MEMHLLEMRLSFSTELPNSCVLSCLFEQVKDNQGETAESGHIRLYEMAPPNETQVQLMII